MIKSHWHAMINQTKSTLPGSDNIVRHVLENGIILLIYENHTSPTVVISGYVPAGSQDDPRDKLGLANLAIDVMERGTVNRSFEQLYEEVESIGASFGLNAGSQTTYFGVKGLSENQDFLLALIKDVLCNPSFDPAQVEKARAEVITDIFERDNDTRRTASRLFYTLAYPQSHPYHWSQLGYLETVESITREDLVAFHERYISPEHMVVVIVGDVLAEQVISMCQAVFADWQHTAVSRRALPRVPRLTQQLRESVCIEDKTQSNIVLGWPGPTRANPDFLPCFLANTVFGVFGMYGRLGTRIREENGLAYYAYSSISGGLGQGPWRIHTGVDPENIQKVISILEDEIQHLLDVHISEDELADSKAFLTGSLPMHLETNEGVMQSIINIELHNLGLDYLRRYKDTILSINAVDLQDACRRWMHPQHYALAVAGPEYTVDGE